MDSQESPLHHAPQTHLQSSPHHHRHHHHYQQPPPPPHGHGTVVPPPLPHLQPQQQQQLNSYTVPNNNINIPTSNNIQQHQHQQQQQQQQSQQFPFNSISGPKPNPDFTDGSSAAGAATAAAATTGLSIEPAKKKRGRPRKYSPDGNIALGLSPNQLTPVAHTDSAIGGNGAASSENPSKKARGRPPCSSKKQQEALGAVGVGFGFTPHLITVNVGEDIASKVMTFSQQGPRAVCIISANGAVCNVTLRQSTTGGGTVTYEGRFEIISLSGSFLLSESNGNRSRTGGLSVSLCGPDGRVFGGVVAGMLMAATPVQVVVGSFIADSKKPKSLAPPVAPPSNMLNFGAPVTEASSPSQGASSDSSDENGSSPLTHKPDPYGNTTQPMHGMPMYWGNQTM